MSPIKLTVLTLTLIATSGFGTVSFAKEVKTNSETLNNSRIQKNIKDTKTTGKETLPQEKCRRRPYC